MHVFLGRSHNFPSEGGDGARRDASQKIKDGSTNSSTGRENPPFLPVILLRLHNFWVSVFLCWRWKQIPSEWVKRYRRYLGHKFPELWLLITNSNVRFKVEQGSWISWILINRNVQSVLIKTANPLCCGAAKQSKRDSLRRSLLSFPLVGLPLVSFWLVSSASQRCGTKRLQHQNA